MRVSSRTTRCSCLPTDCAVVRGLSRSPITTRHTSRPPPKFARPTRASKPCLRSALPISRALLSAGVDSSSSAILAVGLLQHRQALVELRQPQLLADRDDVDVADRRIRHLHQVEHRRARLAVGAGRDLRDGVARLHHHVLIGRQRQARDRPPISRTLGHRRRHARRPPAAAPRPAGSHGHAADRAPRRPAIGSGRRRRRGRCVRGWCLRGGTAAAPPAARPAPRLRARRWRRGATSAARRHVGHRRRSTPPSRPRRAPRRSRAGACSAASRAAIAASGPIAGATARRRVLGAPRRARRHCRRSPRPMPHRRRGSRRRRRSGARAARAPALPAAIPVARPRAAPGRPTLWSARRVAAQQAAADRQEADHQRHHDDRDDAELRQPRRLRGALVDGDRRGRRLDDVAGDDRATRRSADRPPPRSRRRRRCASCRARSRSPARCRRRC